MASAKITGIFLSLAATTSFAEPAKNPDTMLVEPIPATALLTRPHELFQDQNGNKLIYLPGNASLHAIYLSRAMKKDPDAKALSPDQLPEPADISGGWYFAPAGSTDFKEVHSRMKQISADHMDVKISLFREKGTTGDTILLQTSGKWLYQPDGNGMYFKPYGMDNPRPDFPALEGLCDKGVTRFDHMDPKKYDIKKFSFFNVKNPENKNDRGILEVPVCENKNLRWQKP